MVEAGVVEADLVERTVAVRLEPVARSERDRVQNDGYERANARADRQRAARRCHAHCHVRRGVSISLPVRRYRGPTRDYEFSHVCRTIP